MLLLGNYAFFAAFAPSETTAIAKFLERPVNFKFKNPLKGNNPEEEYIYLSHARDC